MGNLALIYQQDQNSNQRLFCINRKMTNNKKEFLKMYDQAVILLKKFKLSNDRISQSLGVEHHSSITLKLNSQQGTYNENIKKLYQILEKLQSSYLDPDTARKIGLVKQQYKIQKDRHSNILKSIKQLHKSSENKIVAQKAQKQNYVTYPASQKLNAKNKTFNQRQNLQNQSYSNTTSHSINKDSFEEIVEYDYEIECKLMNQKNLIIAQTEKNITNVYNITRQCREMVNYQGEHLQIISDQIFKTKQNTGFAVKNLKEANEYSKKRKRKIFIFSLLILFVVALTFIVLIF